MARRTETLPRPIVDSERLFLAVATGDGDRILQLTASIAHWRDDVLNGVSFIEDGPGYRDRLLGMQVLYGHMYPTPLELKPSDYFHRHIYAPSSMLPSV